MNCTRQSWVIGIGLLIAGAPAVSAQSPTSTMSREVVSATGCVARSGADGAGAGFVLEGMRVAPAAGLVEAPRTPASGTPSSNEGSEATNTADPGTGAPPAEARASGAD